MVVKIRQNIITQSIQALAEQFITHSQDSRGHSEATIRTRRSHLKQFVTYCVSHGVLEIQQVTPAFVDDYFADYQCSHSKSTTNTGRRIMKVFLRWAINYKELNLLVRPEGIQLVRVPDALPKALDQKDVLDTISTVKHPQDALIIAFMYESGVRIGEIVELKVKDLNYDTAHIRGKGEIDRMVYISDNLAGLIGEFITKANRQPDDYLFQNVYHGYPDKLTVNTARKRMQNCFKESVGIHMFPHQLRHSFAINLLKAGCDIVTIQRLMGHKDITTTQIYLRVTDNHIKNEYKKYMKLT